MKDENEERPITIGGDSGVVQALSVSGGSVRDIVGSQTNYVLPARPADPDELAGAQALLARMPVADDAPVPLPAQLAPCSYLHQLTPNPLFVGRDVELRAIARVLQAGPGTVAVTTGIGGVGKTQLAIEFAHRYGPYFAGGVFWMSFAEPVGVGTAVALCGSRGLVDWRPDFGRLRTDEQIALVCSAWQSALPRLLIFDNCEDPELLRQWRPPTGGCRVLVTSRRADWGAATGVDDQPLGVLERATSVRLLQSYRADLSAADAVRVAEALGCLPLALHLAGSFLRRYGRYSAADYLAQLDTALLGHPSLRGHGAEASPTGHALSVAQTFAMSYSRLDPDNPIDATACALLARAACLAPGEPIPHDFLLDTLEEQSPARRTNNLLRWLGRLFRGRTTPTSQNSSIEMSAEDGLARLVDLGLLEREDDGALRLHRLLAAYAGEVSNDDEAQEAVERVIIAIGDHFRQKKYEPLSYITPPPGPSPDGH